MKINVSLKRVLLTATSCCWTWTPATSLMVAGALAIHAAPAFAGDVTLTDSENRLNSYGIETLIYNDAAATKNAVKIDGTPALAAVPAGLSAGDLITQINGRKWTDKNGLLAALGSVADGKTVSLSVARLPGSVVELVDTDFAKQFLIEQGLFLAPLSGTSRTITAVAGRAVEANLRVDDEILKINEVGFRTDIEFNDFFYKHLTKDKRVALLVRGGDKLVRAIVFPVAASASAAAPFPTRGVGDGSKGPPVDFPEFLGVGRAPEEIKAGQQQDRFDEVIAARVELYYFRDAHRVAQIINRRVKSYNGPAVTVAEQAAEQARGKFEQDRLDRRQKEFDAEQAASELRVQETKLAASVGALRSVLQKKQNADQLESELADIKTALDKIEAELKGPPDQSNARKAELNLRKEQLTKDQTLKTKQKAQLTSEITSVTSPQGTAGATTNSVVAELKNGITQLLGDIDTQKKVVAAKQNEVRKADDQEQLAAKDQFRREVAAAKTDPDTYVPGDRTNVDPVSQVSISVIGEGVLHLRGPRKGIVKVREMINQIDHPVGQVKIGVMTVQVNGENGSRMENTLKRVEGNISRGRFLTATAGQLLLRSVQEVAHEEAAKHQLSVDPRNRFSEETEQLLATDNFRDDKRLRWQRYLQAFFGSDFLEELRDVDPKLSVLDPLNKLLSLNSNDSLTLAEALVLTGLARADHRLNILCRFDDYIQCELPQREGQWIVTTGAHKCYDPRWWGDAKGGRAKVFEDGNRKYKFQAVKAIYERTACQFGSDDSNRLNAFQHAVVKLVQGMSLELGLHHKRDALIQKRAFVNRMNNGGRPTLTEVQRVFLDEQIAILEEQHLDAQDALRGQKAAIDKIIKQIVVAMEEDVYAQFYDPALERVRKAAQEWDVEMSQIERTTILTNNRAFGKVTPQASFEFDLPKRDIAIAEALKAAYALHKDLGPLLADPEFGTLAKMFAGQSIGGGVADGTVKSMLPSMNASDQQQLLFADTAVPPKFGTELEKLIPNPAIYKFETGTGYEVRPVIQPDGQSVAFDFNYLYTTDLLEPTRPDERSLGRVKRHFVNTEVQLGNLEWREISRYEVALKAARNSRGVPLLEDVPVAGVLFRPLPQAKKSIQKNIIIGQATIYPTIQDLLGLRPASQAYLNHQEIAKDGYEEFQRENALMRTLNSNLDAQVDSMIRGACPPDVPFCPPKLPVPPAPAMNRSSAPGSATPASAQQRSAPRAPRLLPENPTVEFSEPAPISPEVIQRMSYQKTTTRPATPAAPRKVK